MAPVAIMSSPPPTGADYNHTSLKTSVSSLTTPTIDRTASAPAVPTVAGLKSSSIHDDSFVFDDIESALAAFKDGEFLVVVDDEGRENEGDLIIAAAKVTTEQMAWLIKTSSGFICTALPGERLEALRLPMMVEDNTEQYKTAYTISADYKHGTTTGISAHDRALTARMLAHGADADDFNRPGHMMPLRARDGGTIVRKGHTEAGIDLCRLTGLPLGGTLCELVNDDVQGTMARRDDCRAFANRHGIKMISIEMIAQAMAASNQG